MVRRYGDNRFGNEFVDMTLDINEIFHLDDAQSSTVRTIDTSTAATASSDPSGPGDDDPQDAAVRVLQERSRIAQAMQDVPRYRRILIIEDNQLESDRLASTLRAIFGYDIELTQCATLGTALDAVMGGKQELVFLDDRLGPVDKAERSVPFLRTARCDALIIVVSSFIDRRRRAEIMKLGVGEVIDKDELDSLSICQALINAHRNQTSE